MHHRRRDFIATGLAAGATLAFGPSFWRRTLSASAAVPGAGPYGPLAAPDANGLRLPAGFASRLVAQGGQAVGATGYVWHAASDGAATFAGSEGGWILVSNSEVDGGRGGASAIHFSATGEIVDAGRILAATSRNCAGGATPWGTWLSCEETDGGRVWECDPLARAVVDQVEPPPAVRPALGVFRHEAIAVDPAGRRLYLTEDQVDGGLYRFTPTAWPDLAAGVLEIATVAEDRTVTWTEVPDPAAAITPTRRQVAGSTRFRRGEGIWFDSAKVYVATTDDNRIHAYDTASETIEVLYDAQALGASPPLVGVDSITVSRSGDLFVCEDNNESDGIDIGILTPEGEVARFLTATGSPHLGSELCGAVFDPTGDRLYFSSQTALGGRGAIYEVTGPFRSGPDEPPPDEPPPDEPPPDEPPPDEPPPDEPPPDTVAPDLRLIAPRRYDLSEFIADGLAASAEVSERGSMSVVLSATLAGRSPPPGTVATPKLQRLAEASMRVQAGETQFRVRPARRARNMVRGRPPFLATLTVTARDRAGNETVQSRTIRLR